MSGPEPTGVEDLLFKLLEEAEEHGAEALEDACRAHPEQARELRAVFARFRQLGLLGELESDERFPEHLGDFRLIRRLGEGGMGVVYLAEQESLGRLVALKLVRPEHLYFPKARERFRREIRAVALMNHPGIVPVYTSGEADGIPYFAMERVDGCSLKELLDHLEGRDPNELTGSDLAAALAARTNAEVPAGPLDECTWPEACWRIAREMAEALDHAHGRGVIHRDVKPSNVAVTRAGRAMLLDFGLASRAGGRMTRTGSQPGSLAYMSPEQVRGDPEIDSRTDVYSLGVTLFELLTLRRPFQGRTPEELGRHILEGFPGTATKLLRGIPRDARAVLRTAMEQDPGHRYATAADFARDLGNLLARRPVEARRTGVWLRAIRWAQRHPTAGAAALVAGVLLLAGALLVAWQQREHGIALSAQVALAREQTELAEAERAAAERVADFLAELFRNANLQVAGAKVPTALDLLRAGADQLDQALSDSPLVHARLDGVIGLAFMSLEEHWAALEHLERALSDRLELLGEDDIDTLRSMVELAVALKASGRLKEAELLGRDALERLERSPHASPAALLVARDELAGILVARGSLEEAIELLRSAHAVALTEFGERSPELAVVRANFARALFQAGEHAEAAALLSSSAEIYRQLGGDQYTKTLELATTLVDLYLRSGDHQLALEIMEPLLEECARTLGEEHERTLLTMNNLAVVYDRLGRLEEAAALEGRALEAMLRKYPPNDLRVLIIQNSLGESLRQMERFEEAEQLLLAAQRGFEAQLDERHPYRVVNLTATALLFMETGRLEEAERRAAAALERTAGGDPQRAERQAILDEIRAGLERAQDGP